MVFEIAGYENVRYSSIFIGPTTTIDGNKVPLILWPHGGPHSVIATSFMQDVYYFLMLGYSILFVNYRGSLGAGNDSVLSLPGNVGDSDVKDCYQALQECLSTFENIDSDRYVIPNYCFNLRTVFMMLQFCHLILTIILTPFANIGCAYLVDHMVVF